MKPVHDSLRTLPNRHIFLEQIDVMLKRNPHHSMLLIDVVRFSDVSSSFGYELGDELLLTIANRISYLFTGHHAQLGRISGDIFGLVIPGKFSQVQLQRFYIHLIEHFKTPIGVGDHSFIADFNVGAVSNEESAIAASQFFTRVEAALKQAKQNRYDNFCYLSLVDKPDNSRSITLKADLKRALSHHELEIYYQPKVNLRTLEIVGAECLLRWNHPLDGVLFPGALIEAAESYNMMNEMGYWVLEAAFKGVKELAAANVRLKLSVNMSPTQLYDPHFVDQLAEFARVYEVDLGQIEIELTEDVALSNSFVVTSQLTQIRALGVSVAIDDFGKGYSNLAYMRNIELDTIKVDKTFVMELSESPINRAVIEASKLIATAANCELVAEGIENIHQLHVLREIGVMEGQGFLFSRAVPINDFIRLTQQDFIVGNSHARLSRVGDTAK
ncbi:bifunctional diguanylate cyclase/phosphodiesterase [Paraglaciecola chathamensis]|uniref:Bifunctional diguanylate cyclase/phosphodiesterase n=1 Tax=Paraglaciecola chathamensis TaxID=368405 RepID=A0ABS0WFC1_9ALTE|nr:bifunctional diguanylate cyclase/phosphodiesterase [Paraglaciecola chathamensis]MBJ2137149.1 bifunctional diguanylate cyclase/phosphodiesterase [Paraglaciecola chathamensis]